jgi:hypothetical protein
LNLLKKPVAKAKTSSRSFLLNIRPIDDPKIAIVEMVRTINNLQKDASISDLTIYTTTVLNTATINAGSRQSRRKAAIL